MAVSEAMKAFPKAMVSFAEAIRGAGQALGSVPCGPREPAPSGPVPESVRITSSGARVPAPVVRACPPPRKPAAEPPAAVPPHAPPAPAGAGRGAALLARPMFRTAARILFPARPLARPGDRSAQAARTQILAPVPGPVRLPFGLPRVSLAPAALALALSALFAA
ncbi:MAG: hypothetical protein LBQ12_10740, partial [Deltaproteobacteria bacterium]|nr:hypothetical protein [Deltaproteobacteria bacterium]